MAKGNVLIGAVRGKVGDVVMYEVDGQQRARARNRHPRNPKTPQQQLGRAIMASVLQMYSAAKMLLDHSFEGKNNPKANYSRFMKVNCDKLRAELAADMARAIPAQSTARVVTPQSPNPCPWTYIVSEGTLQQNIFTIGEYYNTMAFGIDPNLLETPTQDVLKIGDIFTVLMISTMDASGYDDLLSPRTVFGFIRFTVKAVNATTFEDVLYDDIFKIETYACRFQENMYCDEAESLNYCFPGTQGKGAIAIIRSRDDSKLRSNSQFVCSAGLPWGLYYGQALDAWGRVGNGPGHSHRILEGGQPTEK